MPCQGCVGWMGQQTGTFTKYWCPADSTFHFDWEPCGATTPPPSGSPPPPSGTTTPVTTMAPLAGTVAGCGSCRKGCLPSLSTITPSGATALSIAGGTTAPCPCANGTGVRRPIPWWAWVLGALGAISVLRRVANG